MRLVFLLCSRGLEDKDDEEEEEDAEDEDTEEEEMSEENTPPPQSGRRVSMQREHAVEKKPITMDEKGEPYGALVGAFHTGLRALVRALDPNGNFVEQTEATKDRFFKRLWQGMTWLSLQKPSTLFACYFLWHILCRTSSVHVGQDYVTFLSPSMLGFPVK